MKKKKTVASIKNLGTGILRYQTGPPNLTKYPPIASLTNLYPQRRMPVLIHLLLSPLTSSLSSDPSSQRGLPEARSHLQDRSERRHTALDTGVQQIRNNCAILFYFCKFMLIEYISYLRKASSFVFLSFNPSCFKIKSTIVLYTHI